MSESNSQDLQTLAARLEAVRADLDQALDGAVKRTNTMRVALIVIIVILIGYFWFSYHALKENATVDAVFGLASERLDEFMAGGEEKVTAKLIEIAPDVIDQAAAQLAAAPQLAVERIREIAREQADNVLPELEMQVTQGLNETINIAAARAQEEAGGELDEAAFNKLTDQVAVQYGEHLRKMIQDAHASYAQRADRLIAEGQEKVGDKLTAALIDAAPNVVDQVAAQIAAAPAVVTEEIRMRVRNEAESALPELEAQVIASLEETLDRVHAKAEEESGGKMDEQAFNQLSARIADEYGKQIRQMVQQAHGRFDEHAGQLYGYFQLLAEGTDEQLTARQKHHREMVVSVLAVLEKYAMQNPDFLFLAPDPQ